MLIKQGVNYLSQTLSCFFFHIFIIIKFLSVLESLHGFDVIAIWLEGILEYHSVLRFPLFCFCSCSPAVWNLAWNLIRKMTQRKCENAHKNYAYTFAFFMHVMVWLRRKQMIREGLLERLYRISSCCWLPLCGCVILGKLLYISVTQVLQPWIETHHAFFTGQL